MRDDFEAKNKQLLDEMPRFYSSRLDYFQPSFESLIRAQVRLLPVPEHWPRHGLCRHISCQPPLPTPEGDLAILCQDSHPPTLPRALLRGKAARGLWSFAGVCFGLCGALWLISA